MRFSLALPITAVAAFALTPAIAQKRQPTPEQRIERLEKQVRQVQKQVFPKGQPADTAGFSDDPAATQTTVNNLNGRLDAIERHREAQGLTDDADRHPDGVIIDISRKRVLLDGEPAGLTYKEFELLQYLVLREGRTIDRHELIDGLWAGEDDVPNERTIDVHVRRLRSKLAHYQDIVRTVRGVGYRFDRHADVSIRQASTPSPDVF